MEKEQQLYDPLFSFEEKLMRPLITFVLLRSENKRHLIEVFSTKIAIRNQ